MPQPPDVSSRVRAYTDERVASWRTGGDQGQRTAVGLLTVMSLIMLSISLVDYAWVPASWFVVPMLLGMMVLRHRPLIVLVAIIVVCVTVTVTTESVTNGTTPGRVSTLVAIAVVALLVLFVSSHRRSALPQAVGEAMLDDLRDRLQSQGKVPPLPAGWSSQSAMKDAGGTKFSGDFLVADLDSTGSKLEIILVDVCGKGVAAGTRSLQLAGALGGLIGALPPLGLFSAANNFLMRQRWNDGFATAVHVVIDLRTGFYTILSAGHPPALRWDPIRAVWLEDGARGLALGITDRPEFDRSEGYLEAGAALMFYTDGVVESRSRDVMAGVAWLQERAGEIVEHSFADAPELLLKEVDADDDQAVLILAHIDPSDLATPRSARHLNQLP